MPLIADRQWKDHPVLLAPSEEECSFLAEEDIAMLHAIHTRAIELSESDPLNHGVVLDSWRLIEKQYEEGADEVWVFGGNRSSKSYLAAWFVMRALVMNPGAKIFCWSQNDKTSKWFQMPYLWNLMPADFKKKRRDSVTKIVYSQANGFTDGNFILPNESHCIFRTYTAFQNDETIIEGAELGAKGEMGAVNIGNWLDEYLGGPELVKTLRQRCWTRNSKNLVTFTPIYHYTETVRSVLEGAVTLETRETDPELGIPEPRNVVPVLQRPSAGNEFVAENTRMVYLNTADNPFSDFSRTKRDMMGKPPEHILCRVYGVPTKSQKALFPMFGEDNIFDPDQLPGNLTHYHTLDPAGARNHFMQWVGVDVHGVWWVWKEWPDIEMGPWATWKEGRWRPGPGSENEGYGAQEYHDRVFAPIEEGVEVWERVIDPRMGTATYMGDKGEESIIQKFDDVGVSFIAAPGLHEDDGLSALQALMYWDPSEPRTPQNMPHFMVSSECENTITALREYAGKDDSGSRKTTEAWKDPIDCLRYLATYGPEHYEETNYTASRVGAGGY